MPSTNLTKSAMAVLGCAGAAVAAPVLMPYLATLSLPFYGAVLAGAITNETLGGKLVEAIGNTAAGFMTEIGGHFATERLPRALSSAHNFHLEKMLATAYLNSLEAIEEELKADEDERLKGQAVQTLPLLRARIARGLKGRLSALFPLQTAGQSADVAFVNRFSAENVTLLLADEEKWREQLGEEVETTLRRWLNEGHEAEDRAATLTQLSLGRDARLPEPLRSRLRSVMPHRIAHQVSELVKKDDFKEAWIAFQRAHLQGIGRVVDRIETSQEDIRESLDALAQQIEGFIEQDEFVAALAEMQEEYLSQLSSSHGELSRLLERQSEELRGLEDRLGRKIDRSTERLSAEVQRNTAHLSDKIESLDKKVEEAITQDTRRVARNRLRQLPAPPRDFTGREAELEELRHVLRHGGVTISGVQGMGGVGKTALALVLAGEFKDQYPDAQIYLDMKGVSEQPLSPPDAMWHVVGSFHPDMKRPSDGDLLAWYHDVLNRHRALLLYDNAKDSCQIEPLLPPDNCLLLVTSRRHFKVPGMFDKDLNEMTGSDAEALLLEIAPRIETDAAAIARQCGYLPLALRLAASALHKSRALNPSDLQRRLQDKRQRVELVDASFSLSYELLSEELQRRWRMLAIFPSDFDVPAATAVWQTDVDAAKDSLAELEEYSLLDWEEATRRYSLHDLARDFADTRLSATERELAGLLHAAHYFQILWTVDDLFLKGGEAIAEGLSLFDNERINIEVGQSWVAARFKDDEQAAHLCNMYPDVGVHVLNLRLHPRDFIRWHEAGLSAARQLKDRGYEGAHLGNLGHAYAGLGEVHRAIDLYRRQLAITRELVDRRGEGLALGNLGRAYADLGEVRRAIEFYEQRLVIAHETGDRRGEATVLCNLGIAYKNLSEVRRAIEFYEQALAINREIGDRLGEAATLSNLGLAYADLGEARRAIEFYEQALVMAREIGSRRGVSNVLGNLGSVYIELGEVRRAIEFYEQCLDIAREIGDRHVEGNALGNLGLAYIDLGEVRRATELYEQALAVAREIGDRRGESNALGSLGIAYKNLGEVRRAIEFYEQALAINREIDYRPGEATVLSNLSLAYIAIDDMEKAVEYIETALKIFEEIKSPKANIMRDRLEKLRGKSG